MPRRRAASMRLVPASTSISLPSTVSFGISILGGGLRPPSDAPRAQRSGLPPPRTSIAPAKPALGARFFTGELHGRHSASNFGPTGPRRRPPLPPPAIVLP